MVAVRQQEDTKNSKNRIMRNRNISYKIYAVLLLSNMFIKKQEKYNLLTPLKLPPKVPLLSAHCTH